MTAMPLLQRAAWIALAAVLCMPVPLQAAERRFMPVPTPPSQRIDVINGMPILSAAGSRFHAGASLSASSSKQGRLMVSIKNKDQGPLAMGPAAVVASAPGQVLSLREIGPDGKPASTSAGKAVQPGEIFVVQYLVELPRKQRGQLAGLSVTVDLAGERIVLEFKEVQ